MIISNSNKNNHNGDTASTVVVSSASASSATRAVISMVAWIGFAIAAWKIPRSILKHNLEIARIPPPYQIVGDAVVVDFELDQPLVNPPTVDNTLLRCSAIWLPLAFFVLHAWFFSTGRWASSSPSSSSGNKPLFWQRIYNAATVVAAFANAIGVSEGTTVLVKQWVRRKRPNFYALCRFDKTTKFCMNSIEHVQDANLSFPSGHSSLSACGMVFLVWYLRGTHRERHHYTEVGRLELLVKTCGPLGWTIFVASSRLVDHWHHPSDIIAGLGLGAISATIVYGLWYPYPWSPYRGIPRTLLRTKAAAPNLHAGDDDRVPTAELTTLLPSTSQAKRRPFQSPASGGSLA